MKSKNQKALEMTEKLKNEKIPKILLNMSLPMIIAMVVNGIYYLVDTAFVGLAEGADAIAGLAVVFPVQMAAIAIATMIGIGAASLVSKNLGEDNKDKASEIVRNTIVLCIYLGVILAIVLFPFRTQILNSFGADEQIYHHANSYYSIIIPGIILVLLSFAETNMIRAEGNAKLAAIIMFAGSALNIVFDAVFIFILHMGAAGAALGTVVARLITTLWLSSYYIRKKSILKVTMKSLKLDWKICKGICTLGFGAFANQMGFSLLAMVINISLKKYGSVLDLSIYGVISKIHIFVTMPLMGLAQGFQAVTAYNIGAKNYDRVKSSFKYSIIYSIIIGTIMFIFLIFMPKSILRLFTDDLGVITNGVIPLRTTMIMVPIIGMHSIAYFYFISIHKPKKAILVSLFRQVIFLLPLIVILPLFMGQIGLWAAYPIADILSVLSGLIMVKRYSDKISLNT